MSFEPLEKIYSRDGMDEQCRLQYSLNSFAELEANSIPETVFYYWQALKGDGRELPHVEQFQPKAIFGPNICYFIRAMETASVNPDYFVVRDHYAHKTTPFSDGMLDRRLVEFPSRIHVEATQREYLRCLESRTPLYFRVSQLICGIPRNYSKLMLPLVDDSGRIVRVAYGLTRFNYLQQQVN